MRRLALLLLAPLAAWAQTETRELVGQIGSRPALLVLHASRTAEGAWQMAGEYVVLLMNWTESPADLAIEIPDWLAPALL